MKLEEYAALTIGAIFMYARQMEMRTPLEYMDVANAISSILFVITTSVLFVLAEMESTVVKITQHVTLVFIYSPCLSQSQDRAVGIATAHGLDGRGVGVRVPVEARFFSSPRRRDRFWGLPSLL
jgi:hypothetical protein